MSVVSSERAFCSNFLQLMSVSSGIKYKNDYKRDLSTISSLGPSLPKLQVARKSIPTSKDSASSESIKLNFKSIKPPKFNVSFESDTNNTLYTIKEQLITAVADLAEYHPSQLKFLIKGKVIQDSNVVESLISHIKDSEISFMVMISKDSSAPSTASTSSPPASVNSSSQSSDEPTKRATVSEINDLTWSKINEVLVSQYDEDQAATILKRFKKGWETTK